MAADEHHGYVWLVADPWTPAWLPGSEHIDSLRVLRRDQQSVGDGLLCAMFAEAKSAKRLTSYRSEAQKAAVHLCTFAGPGTTTLVTLPTGAGKSSARSSRRGTTCEGAGSGGTTLVLVPTEALALDQVRESRSFFRDSTHEEYAPHALTGDTPPEDRAAIMDGI